MTTLAPTARRTTRVPTRTRQLRDIHQAAHRAGFETREGKDRSQYEAVLIAVCGRTSSRQATRPEREAILEHFDALIHATRPYSAAELDFIHNASSVDELWA